MRLISNAARKRRHFTQQFCLFIDVFYVNAYLTILKNFWQALSCLQVQRIYISNEMLRPCICFVRNQSRTSCTYKNCTVPRAVE